MSASTVDWEGYKRWEDVGRLFAREVGLKPGEPFIAVHARHGDFTINCWKTSGGVCFPPLDALEAVVKEVKEGLRTKSGIEIARAMNRTTSDGRRSRKGLETSDV